MQASMMPDQAAGRGTPARAPFAPASRPASPAAQAGVETSLGERLSALGRGYAQGGLVGAIGDMMQGGEGVQRNATYRMLVARGLPPEQARDVVRSPAILQQILPSLFGNSAPQIVNIPGPYGTQTSVYWDAQSRRFQPAEGLMPGAPPPAQAQPAAPAVAPPPVLGAQAPGGQPAPASPPALNLGGAAAPPAVPAPASGVAPTGPPPRGARPELTPDGQFVLGNAAPQVPTGFVQRIGPGGRGFLWTLDGRPALEGAHAAQERDQQRERRASEHGEQARQADSVSEVIQQARLLVGVPNFDNALSLGRQRFDVGIPTPWGTVGGNAMALPQGIGRMIDPQNPSWGALDGIRSVQRQLELLVARPLMRGQGAVSESERALLSEAIGQLPQASNAADFQFRLNAIERMMSAAMRNTPGGVTGAAAEPSRPTQAEIGALVGNGPYGPTYSEDGIIALARKYNVRPADMRNYVVGIINNSDPR